MLSEYSIFTAYSELCYNQLQCPDSTGLAARATRSGRVSLPRMEFWRGERLSYRFSQPVLEVPTGERDAVAKPRGGGSKRDAAAAPAAKRSKRADGAQTRPNGAGDTSREMSGSSDKQTRLQPSWHRRGNRYHH